MENESIETTSDICKLFNHAEKLKAKFKNPRAAINFYTNRLEEISNTKKCTFLELIKRAEENQEDQIFSEALSISRKIQFLKRTEG